MNIKQQQEQLNIKMEQQQGTHKHEEVCCFLRLKLTALTFTLRIWQSAMKT